MTKTDDKLLAAALDTAAKSIRDIWDDGSIPNQVPVWRLSDIQLTWIAAQAIFAYQTERRRQAMELRHDMEEMVQTFVEPKDKLSPDDESLARVILPMLRRFVTERELHLRPIGEWHADQVKEMIVTIAHAAFEIMTDENLGETDPDDLPIEAGKLLQAG